MKRYAKRYVSFQADGDWWQSVLLEAGIEFPQLIGCEKTYRLVMERVDHPRKEKSVK